MKSCLLRYLATKRTQPFPKLWLLHWLLKYLPFSFVVMNTFLGSKEKENSPGAIYHLVFLQLPCKPG